MQLPENQPAFELPPQATASTPTIFAAVYGGTKTKAKAKKKSVAFARRGTASASRRSRRTPAKAKQSRR